jgi:nicotinate-nucleotide adenylyltransferase
MKVGLYFGSFNPIHVGHVELAKYLLHCTSLDEIWFVVSPQNPLKQTEKLLCDDMRLAMVRSGVWRESTGDLYCFGSYQKW